MTGCNKEAFDFYRLSSLCTIFNQAEVTSFSNGWGCWRSTEQTHCSECCKSDRKLSVGRNNHWHDFLPMYGIHVLMEGGDREFWKLMWAYLRFLFSITWLHLHQLLLTPGWKVIVCELLYGHRCQSAWIKAQSSIMMANSSFKVLILWWLFSDVHQPNKCCVLPFKGKEMSKWGTGNYTMARSFQRSDCFLFCLLFVFWILALPCRLHPH